MKVKLCDLNPAVDEKLPGRTDDKSGIGVHYVDAYIKPMNVKLEDGTAVRCKRRGLKVTLSAGGKKGEGLMRRLEVGFTSPFDGLLTEGREALGTAGQEAGGTGFV